MGWVIACAATDIDAEDVRWFHYGGKTYAVYHSPDNKFYATDGVCTHQFAELAHGFVIDNVIECPVHNGRFDYTTGKALGAPVCVNLKTYRVKVEDGNILIDSEWSAAGVREDGGGGMGRP